MLVEDVMTLEVVTCGVEVSIDLVKDPTVSLARPLIETDAAWKTVASAPTPEEACRLANEDLLRLIGRQHDLDFTDAYMFSSLVVDLEISQVVDPLVTVRNAISKDHLSVAL